MVKLLACVLLLAGCYGDTYHCTTDEQCNLGVGGRCEQDGFCTQYDTDCATLRSYSDHSGGRSNACFADQVTPVNPCMGGQPAAPREGCFAQVCDTVASCCDVMWTDTCAQLAEQLCDVRCDTRLAVTARTDSSDERFEATWDGEQWTIAPRTDLEGPFLWVGPAPGSSEPRLAGRVGEELVVGDTRLPAATNYCRSATTADIDRDSRDTLIANYTDGTGEIWKLDDSTMRETSAGAQYPWTWGDINHDAFPDAVTNNNGAYTYQVNEDADDGTHARTLLAEATGMVQGGKTPGPPPIRNVDWVDFDRDGTLDLIVFGSSLRIHARDEGLSDNAQHDLDCDPPSEMYSCRRNSVTYGGATLQGTTEAALLIAVYPGRKLYRAQFTDGKVVVDPIAFPGDTCTCPSTCTNCPGSLCECTYDCSTCNTIAAVVVRDLDGDRQLDLIAIDSRLQIYTALAATNFAFGAPTPIVATLPPAFVSVDVSVAGAPIP